MDNQDSFSDSEEEVLPKFQKKRSKSIINPEYQLKTNDITTNNNENEQKGQQNKPKANIGKRFEEMLKQQKEKEINKETTSVKAVPNKLGLKFGGLQNMLAGRLSSAEGMQNFAFGMKQNIEKQLKGNTCNNKNEDSNNKDNNKSGFDAVEKARRQTVIIKKKKPHKKGFVNLDLDKIVEIKEENINTNVNINVNNNVNNNDKNISGKGQNFESKKESNEINSINKNIKDNNAGSVSLDEHNSNKNELKRLSHADVMSCLKSKLMQNMVQNKGNEQGIKKEDNKIKTNSNELNNEINNDKNINTFKSNELMKNDLSENKKVEESTNCNNEKSLNITKDTKDTNDSNKINKVENKEKIENNVKEEESMSNNKINNKIDNTQKTNESLDPDSELSSKDINRETHRNTVLQRNNNKLNEKINPRKKMSKKEKDLKIADLIKHLKEKNKQNIAQDIDAEEENTCKSTFKLIIDNIEEQIPEYNKKQRKNFSSVRKTLVTKVHFGELQKNTKNEINRKTSLSLDKNQQNNRNNNDSSNNSKNNSDINIIQVNDKVNIDDDKNEKNNNDNNDKKDINNANISQPNNLNKEDIKNNQIKNDENNNVEPKKFNKKLAMLYDDEDED